MIDATTFLTIVLMASVTLLTRVLGYAGLRNRELGPRATAMMKAAPGCVLLSVIAPTFASGRAADILALLLTLLAATRLPMLATVAIGIAAASILRHLTG